MTLEVSLRTRAGGQRTDALEQLTPDDWFARAEGDQEPLPDGGAAELEAEASEVAQVPRRIKGGRVSATAETTPTLDELRTRLEQERAEADAADRDLGAAALDAKDPKRASKRVADAHAAVERTRAAIGELGDPPPRGRVKAPGTGRPLAWDVETLDQGLIRSLPNGAMGRFPIHRFKDLPDKWGAGPDEFEARITRARELAAQEAEKVAELEVLDPKP